MNAIETGLVALTGAQILTMGFDEFHFHHKRGLPRWERVGHPIDTFLTLSAVIIPAFAAPTSDAKTWYWSLAGLSSLVITKDEFIHARLCSPGEHWVHSLQFVLHPIVLLLAGLAWGFDWLRVFACLTLAFLVYQITYWNFAWQKREPMHP